MYWLFKSEPNDYAFNDLLRDGRAAWTGVKNFQAIGNLKKAAPGDQVFFYHTGKEKSVVGVAEVATHPYTHSSGDTVVDIIPKNALTQAVSLKMVKEDPFFQDWELVRLPRLSVMPVQPQYWERVLQMSGQNY